MELLEKQLDSEVKFEGKILTVTQDIALLPNGNKAVRDVVHHGGGVGVLPLTEDNKIFMVKQFRYPTQKVLLEIPAGKLEKGEKPLDCGIRELREETGCRAENYTSLGAILPTPAYDTEKIYIFLATGIEKIAKQSLDTDEFINVFEMDFEDVLEMVMSGEIEDAKTAAAILKVNNLKLKGKI